MKFFSSPRLPAIMLAASIIAQGNTLQAATPPPATAILALTPETASWALGGDIKGEIALQNGRTDTPVALRFIDEMREGDARILRYGLNGVPGCELELRLESQSAGYTALTMTFKNESKQQLWLEPAFRMALPQGMTSWYDGFQLQKSAKGRDEIAGTLPFAAAFDATQGVAIGIDPTQLVSHFRSKVSGEEQRTLEFASKMVVDPNGGIETRRFVIFPFRADYGYLNAVDAYQRFFPTAFQATPGIHPQVAAGTNGGSIWRTQHSRYPGSKESGYFPQMLEAARWMGGGWDWCYSGFGGRPGDWLCTEEETGDWLVEPKKGSGEKVKFRDDAKMSATEFLQTNLDACTRLVDITRAPLLYIIPSYCEYELAEKKFPDAIYYENGKPRASGPPWVGKFDRSFQMYPYGNSFGDYTAAALKTIAGRTNIYGFAFDCIDRANSRYTGPGTERSPGRAYDSKVGVYVCNETAHNFIAQTTHQLKHDGYTLALTGNFRGSSGAYLAATGMDAALLEHSPWDDRPLPAQARLLMGKKSITYLHGYGRIPELEKLEGPKLKEIISALADFTVLQAFRYAIYPSLHSVIGSPKMIHYHSIFRDLFVHYGWEPIPAARGGEKLWISRYGDGAGGVLFAGNGTPKADSHPLVADARYFEAGSVAFVNYETARTATKSVSNAIAKDRTTIPLALGRGEMLLAAAALQWEQPVEANVEGRRTAIPGVETVDTLKITGIAPEKQALFTTGLPGQRLVSVTVNGKEIPFNTEGKKERFEATFAAGENMVVLRHQPEFRNTAREQIANAPFLDAEKKAAFTIVLGDENPETVRQAQRIKALFTKMEYMAPLFEVATCTKDTLPDDATLLVYIGRKEGREGTPLASVKIGNGPGEIIGADKWIGVVGDSPEALEQATSLLLDQLFERYPNYGHLAVSDKNLQMYAHTYKRDIFYKKTGLEYLPWEAPQ